MPVWAKPWVLTAGGWCFRIRLILCRPFLICRSDFPAIVHPASFPLSQLTDTKFLIMNDAVTIPGVELPQVPIIKGDAKSISIAAASIIANPGPPHNVFFMNNAYTWLPAVGAGVPIISQNKIYLKRYYETGISNENEL